METHINDLHFLLKGLHNVWERNPFNSKDLYRLLNKAASYIKVDDFVRFKETSEFSNAIRTGNINVFHYGVLVYDNYSLSQKSTLIPFKYAFSKKEHDPLYGLNSSLGQSESNVRDFIYGNINNSEKVSKLGFDGYLLFSHDLDSGEPSWSVQTNYGENILLEDADKLWGLEMGVLNIFKKDIFMYNGVNHGTIYTAIKIIDFDVEGRSSSYLTVNCDNKEFIDSFISAKECQKRISLLVSAVRSLYTQIHSDIQKIESIKSAKAAIMSRNMSHNIGSHVMSYLKQNLGSVKDIVTDGILSDLINGENELSKKLENTTENTTLPFLMGLGHFISYLQERQDFIATIATDYIPYFGNVNFKDSIYDTLNPDKRAERHSERKNGKTDNILLGNIARSEGLGRRTTTTTDDQTKRTGLRDIVLKFRGSFDGNSVVDRDENGNEGPIKNQNAYDELKEMRKYDFSLPGGIVGRQAFFSIMENIIRNAAKHGNWREQDNLEFTFDIFSCKKEDIERLPSNDNVNENCLSLKEVIERFYLGAKDVKDLYFVTITDNCDFAPPSETGEAIMTALGKLRKALTSDYVSDSGEMENENKGLKEMRISAAWMRAIKDESMCFSPYILDKKSKDTEPLERDKYDKDTDVWKIKNTDQNAPLLYARVSAKKEYDDGEELVTGRNLQYIFCVQIPKKVAVILNKKENEVEGINNNLERINWRAYTVEGFSKERNKSYEFILVDDACDNIEKTYFDIRSEATARTFRFSNINGLERELFVKRLEDENYDGEDDLLLFYKSLVDYQDGDRIVVDDKTTSAKNENNNACIKIGDGINEAGVKYIYRRHHDAEAEFTAFMMSNMKDTVEFVEGVSGNNSTDRLIRNEKLNDSWFYRHLRAMKQQVAVFDERLFSKITGLEEPDFNGTDIALCNDITALSYIQKGFYPFTFISDGSSIKLIGVLCDKQPLYEEKIVRDDPQSPVHSYKCKCGCMAEIEFKNNELTAEYKDCGEYVKKHFHAVTIHQGLLDKIYEWFEIKGGESEKSDKEKVTKGLFQIFSCNSPIVLKEDNAAEKEFLPGLIIHSGRSKPSESDMPQKLPFIQYASLEHAVMDCKYSLVELLDFARYES